MNPVLMVVHNSLAITLRSIDSILQQDVPVKLYVIDNGSTDGTGAEVSRRYPQVTFGRSERNCGVTKAWNAGLTTIFADFDHVLVHSNDVVVPSCYYRLLLEANEPFITGVSTGSEDDLAYWSCGKQVSPSGDKAPHPDFSSFLIRKQVWDTVGPFDERFVMYVQDCDYHVRMKRAGFWAGCLPIRMYHERSSTLRNAPPEIRRAIEIRADADREEFRKLYGCMPGDEKYAELFK